MALWHRRADGETRLASLPLDDTGETARLRFLQEHPKLDDLAIVLKLENHQGLRKQIKLPMAAAENLQQVIAFEMDRMTPFKSDQVYFSALVANATPFQEAMFPLIVAGLHLWSLTITLPKSRALVGDAKGADRKKILDDNDEAAYYSGRVLSSQFFIGAEFPKFFGMVECIMNNEGAAIKVDSANFTGALKE